ncbi:hypothetical protein CI1B_08980 [Bradyrhizobium ivorense]|uniref:Uncharacterized protein n=1 Tax=Bradyrhizobium ivorense TaxID=2511166 RepID=A0A508SVJ2_9BRAD|nr:MULTISPECIES: VanZ family protein [Bradyrhizobium]QOZ24919.1 hypothetical protein XH93_15980 [Bradyrhizobium sp. CCBAU 51753]VIO65791.1 hypothetical protein CI1B_08980 [Bradyrhizobium ivorense]VIO71763.1 hypothetical protein CI41S_31280 [Bradyrhizobium ivorense]
MTDAGIRRLLICAAWLALIVIAITTVAPIYDRPTFGHARIERLVAFMALGAMFAWSYPNRLLFSVLIVSCGAFGLEALQLITPDRHARLLDAFVKLAGGWSGLGFGHLTMSFMRAGRLRLGSQGDG